MFCTFLTIFCAFHQIKSSGSPLHWSLRRAVFVRHAASQHLSGGLQRVSFEPGGEHALNTALPTLRHLDFNTLDRLIAARASTVTKRGGRPSLRRHFTLPLNVTVIMCGWRTERKTSTLSVEYNMHTIIIIILYWCIYKMNPGYLNKACPYGLSYTCSSLLPGAPNWHPPINKRYKKYT